jgi:predicted HAD superfamily Cof-like phosphohydrolase
MSFQDVKAFHLRFGLPTPQVPALLDHDAHHFRLGFMNEELREYVEAFEAGDLAKAADSLVDLDYVVLGTAVMMGLPWEELFAEVHAANMRKVRAEGGDDPRSTRSHRLDVVKPKGWRPPDVEGVLRRASRAAQSR